MPGAVDSRAGPSLGPWPEARGLVCGPWVRCGARDNERSSRGSTCHRSRPKTGTGARLYTPAPMGGAANREELEMTDKSVDALVKGKGMELKEWFKDLDAKLEDWKFSVEESKAGTRVEIHAVALIKHKPKE